MTQTASLLALRQLQREVLGADDAKIHRLVAAVDAASARGAADTLIAPLRPRLTVLRPPRPLRLSRLLFLPLDPLVVPPTRWRPGATGIPRTALLPLTAVAAAGLGAPADAIVAQLAGRTTAETEAVSAFGARLWPLAAKALHGSRPPADWTDASGLHVGEYGPLAQSVAAMLAEGPALFRLAAPHGDPEEDTLAVRLLEGAAAAGAQPLATMLALLLARLPHAGYLLQLADDLASRGNDGSRMAPDRALEFLMSDAAGAAGGATAGGGATLDGLRRAAVLLESLAAPSQQRPTRIARLEAMRRSLDEACRDRFATETGALRAPDAAHLLADQPAGGGPDSGALASDAAVTGIEAMALHLRRVEAVGRRLGGAGFYERMMHETAQRLTASPALGPVDRLRLAEILVGPEAAVAMLGMP